MESSKNRRWFRFSLRTMFSLVTVTSVAMGYVGWQVRVVEERRLMAREIINQGGQVWMGLSDLEAALFLNVPRGWGRRRADMAWGPWPESAFQIPWFRQQLGDLPVFYVVVPQAEKAAMREVFPEAVVLAAEGVIVDGFKIRTTEPFEDRRPQSWR